MPRHPWGWPKIVTTPTDLPSRWRMTQACRDDYHDHCARTDGQCTCTCHRTPTLAARRGTAETGDDDE